MSSSVINLGTGPQEMDPYKAKMRKLAPLPDDMRIFWVGNNIARIEARTTYCLECIMSGQEIPTALDDMAQVIGAGAKLVPDDQKAIIAALMYSNACLVKPSAEAKGSASWTDAGQSSGKALGAGSVIPEGEASIWDRGYVVTLGRDPYEAFVALTVLEKAAEIQIKSKGLGGVKPMSPSHCRSLQRQYARKYSKPGRERRAQELAGAANAALDPGSPSAAALDPGSPSAAALDPGSPGAAASAPGSPGAAAGVDNAAPGLSADADTLIKELKERAALVEYGQKLVEKNLVQGTWGNISIRINDELMLVTPTGLDYDSAGPEDMVAVNIPKLTFDKTGNAPTTEKSMHAKIYEARSDVGAIVHAHSTYCSALAACLMPLEVRNEELAKTLGELLYVSDYAKAGTDKIAENVVKALGPRTGVIMANHGMVACGKDIDEAFEIALSMEDAARRLINDKILDNINKEAARKESQEVME